MRLASPTDVLSRLARSATAGSTASAESALDAATVMLENILGTPLGVADRVDLYDNLPSRYDNPYWVNQVAYLHQMFVTGSVSAYLSDDGSPITDISGMTAESSGFTLHPDLGEVVITTYDIVEGRDVLALSYTAGFVDENDTAIPPWLKEAAISGAVEVLHSQAMSHGKRDVPDMSNTLHRLLYRMVNEHIRSRYRGHSPSRSMVV